MKWDSRCYAIETRHTSWLAVYATPPNPASRREGDDPIHGRGLRRFNLFGSEGQSDLPGVRSGKPLQVFRDDHDGAFPDAALLGMVSDFALDERTARLFGGGADLKLLAIELAELLDVTLDHYQPPVNRALVCSSDTTRM